MSNRSRKRTENIFAGAQERHREVVVKHWQEMVPARLSGFTVEEDLIEGKWNGRLQSSGIRKVRQYLAEPTQFLILKGVAGLGKSTLAATMITDLLKDGRYGSARYESAPMLLQEFSFPDRDREDPVRRSSRVPILMLDDVGAANESITSHQKKGLWSVIDARWSQGSNLTIMTTNMSINSTTDGQGLADWFGESAWDRIKDDLTLIDFQGESMRGKD